MNVDDTPAPPTTRIKYLPPYVCSIITIAIALAPLTHPWPDGYKINISHHRQPATIPTPQLVIERPHMKFQPGAHHNACIIPIIGDRSMTRVIAHALNQTFEGRASRKSWLRRTCVRTRGLNSQVCSVICACAHADRPSGSRAMAEKSRANVLVSTLVRETREFFTM